MQYETWHWYRRRMDSMPKVSAVIEDELKQFGYLIDPLRDK